MMDLKSIKAIVFDYDDTIAKTRQIRYKTLQTIANETFDFKLSNEQIDSAWGIPGNDFLLKIFGNHSKDLDFLWKTYNDYCDRDDNIPYPGAKEYIYQFQKQYQLGILSSSSHKRVFKELELMLFDLVLFVSVQTAEDTHVHKPDPKVFEPMLSKLEMFSIRREEILYVGDSISDYLSSTGYGLQFLGMAHGEREQIVFDREKIPYVESFAELDKVLKEGR
ncbi:HAD family hydrolase [Leptospira ilyithenensis]|uniref:phosphoglycolate phosphatase n=1 Tax=Leptospira ilyithenensis TaxID=2484901 RepID=A0A4V3JX56_9LEPT|nr:HAD-IA family hydrolase [Leptospira ilyithenensis]TGN11117.1 phosphatase [Leptospira ilyithenensis]